MQEIDGRNELPVVYRSGDQFIKALADQLTIPNSFFDVHKSLERASKGKDIQDPKNWVKALVPKEGSVPLNANIDIPNYMYLNFSSAGQMPENISQNSKEGTYIKLLVGEARLRAVQKAMPETYATGLSETSKAIKEIQNLRKSLVQSRRIKINLNSLLTKTASGHVRLGMAIPLTLVTTSLILASCSPGVVGPIMPIPDGAPSSPTPTQPAPTETATQTPTKIPTETPSPRAVDLELVTDEEKLALAPDEIGGLTKSNVSTIKNNLIIYRDVDGNAMQVYDLTTDKELTLPEAGIAELDLVDGSKLEMVAFSDKQEVMDFVAEDAMWFEGDKMDSYRNYPKFRGIIDEMFKIRDAVLGVIPANGNSFTPPYPEKENLKWFNIFIYDVGNNRVIFLYPDKNGNAAVVFFDDPDLKNDRSSFGTFILNSWKYSGIN